MLKRKASLIGLFLLLIVGLIYSLFNTKSEIFSDKGQRVEESLNPEIEMQVERAANASWRPSVKAAPIDPLPDSKSVISDGKKTRLWLGEASDAAEQHLGKVEADFSEPAAVVVEDAFSNIAEGRLAASQLVRPGVGVKEEVVFSPTSNIVTRDGFLVFEDLSVISTEASQGLSGFLDLNSSGVKSEQQNMVLLEGDATVMQVGSKIGKQYRQTMAKLVSINAKLRAADEENAELQARFSLAANQNHILAQIIRDIDLQVKRFTLAN